MLTFDQLDTLRTIVRYGTFSRAAEEMFLTQPAVSQRVKHLEQALGVEMFTRGSSGRGFHLTDEGERVLRFANDVLGALSTLQTELQSKGKVRRETVSVASGPYIAKYVLPRLVAACRERYPHLHVRSVQTGVDDLNDIVRRGDADFAVHSEAYTDPTLRSVPLFRDRVVLVGAPQNSVLQVDALCAEKVAESPFVLSPTNTEPRQIAERWASTMGINLDVIIEGGSYDALKEAAVQGIGLSVLPETIVYEEVRDGRLLAVPMPGMPCDRQMCLEYDPNRQMSPAAEALLLVAQEGHWRAQVPIFNPC